MLMMVQRFDCLVGSEKNDVDRTLDHGRKARFIFIGQCNFITGYSRFIEGEAGGKKGSCSHRWQFSDQR
jgi:hypothetical protein